MAAGPSAARADRLRRAAPRGHFELRERERERDIALFDGTAHRRRGREGS